MKRLLTIAGVLFASILHSTFASDPKIIFDVQGIEKDATTHVLKQVSVVAHSKSLPIAITSDSKNIIVSDVAGDSNKRKITFTSESEKGPMFSWAFRVKYLDSNGQPKYIHYIAYYRDGNFGLTQATDTAEQDAAANP